MFVILRNVLPYAGRMVNINEPFVVVKLIFTDVPRTLCGHSQENLILVIDRSPRCESQRFATTLVVI